MPDALRARIAPPECVDAEERYGQVTSHRSSFERTGPPSVERQTPAEVTRMSTSTAVVVAATTRAQPGGRDVQPFVAGEGGHSRQAPCLGSTQIGDHYRYARRHGLPGKRAPMRARRQIRWPAAPRSMRVLKDVAACHAAEARESRIASSVRLDAKSPASSRRTQIDGRPGSYRAVAARAIDEELQSISASPYRLRHANIGEMRVVARMRVSACAGA